jgi:hypothetical protein
MVDDKATINYVDPSAYGTVLYVRDVLLKRILVHQFDPTGMNDSK